MGIHPHLYLFSYLIDLINLYYLFNPQSIIQVDSCHRVIFTQVYRDCVTCVFPLSSCLPLFGFVPVLISSLLIKSSHLCSSCLLLISLSL